MKLLLILFFFTTLVLLSTNAKLKERQKLLESEIRTSEFCLLKAAKFANTVDPRFYTESTVKNIYKSCLNE